MQYFGTQIASFRGVDLCKEPGYYKGFALKWMWNEQILWKNIYKPWKPIYLLFMRVLVVDDEQEIRLLLSKLLSKMGHQARTASTVDEGRRRIEEYDPEIVILDLFLPDGNGLSLVPDLKRDIPEVGIIINSAYDSPTERSKANDVGADYFLSKPFSRKMLEEALQSIEK